MGRIIRNKSSLVYVMDADSKQLIRNTLLYDYRSFGDREWAYSLFYEGVASLEPGSYSTMFSDEYVVEFDKNQITELGYDYNSITGNLIKLLYDPQLDTYSYPDVSIIYMSKLK